MSRRARALTARAARTWFGAAAGSVVVHVVALLALVRGDAADPARGVWALAPPEQQPESIDVVSLDDPAARPAPAPAPAVTAPAPAARDLPEDDRAHLPATSTAPRVAEGRWREAPAADAGDRAGRVTDSVWRRDRSTLREQLTDGASAYQMARAQTGRPVASPQAVRREPVVGPGDAVRTATPASPSSALEPDPGDESRSGELAHQAAGQVAPDRELVVVDSAPSPEPAQATRGLGPLDAEMGARSFDSQTRGPAGDQHEQRAASAETRPGVTDLSRAGVRAPSDVLTGRGPGDAPGAVDHAASGRAPVEYGGSMAQTVGDQVAERTRERIQDQYIREIERRVHGLCVFPKRLALRLEQGETVVRFVLDADGHLRGSVRVSKSSGFDEFDAEATRAVERAAPFPPLPRTLALPQIQVGIRVAFDNPVIR
jgi:TonB family protein